MSGQLRDTCEAAIANLAASELFDGKEVRELWKELHDARVENFYWRRLSLVVLGTYLKSVA